jgi:hypothetical protein
LASRARIRSTLSGLALCLLAQHARAEPTAAERETARSLLVSGREKRKSGQVKASLADFEKAHAIMRVPTTALDLGKTQQSLGMLVEARASFLEAVRHPPLSSDPPAFKRARHEAKQLADDIAPKLATLTLTASPGAHVKIDDAEISSSSVGVPLKVNPGKHELVASRGTEEKRAAVDLAPGEATTVELLFAGATGAPPAPEPRPVPPQPRSTTSPLVWIGLAAAGIGTAVGTTTGLLAFGASSDIEGRCDAGVRCPPSTHADIDSGRTLGTVSTISFVVAGAGAAVLVWGLLHPSEAAATVTSGQARPQLRTLGLGGSF